MLDHRCSIGLRWPTLMLLVLFLVPLDGMPGYAHMRGMYATRAEAEKRAVELNCKGVFAMGDLWMPCGNERALHEALQRDP